MDSRINKHICWRKLHRLLNEGVSEMTRGLLLGAVLIITLGGCQMETGGGSGYNPGTSGSGGYNPGTGSPGGFNPGTGGRPPIDEGSGNRPNPGLALARDVCVRESEGRGRNVSIESYREVSGGAEVILRVRSSLLPIYSERQRCIFDYDTGRATINKA